MEGENVCVNEEMLVLAFSPDALSQYSIAKAKEMYNFYPPPSLTNCNIQPPPPFFPWSSGNWDPLQLERASSWQQENANHLGYQPLQLDGVVPNYYHRDQILISTISNNSQNMVPSELMFRGHLNNGNKLGSDQLKPMDVNISPLWKPCQYFARGYCKHGNNCRFLHGYLKQHNNYNNDCSLSSLSSSCSRTESFPVDEHFENGSLERLEIELKELLRSIRVPVSIAALPQLYHERYGRTLQAEGYLTESRRHGRAGYNLTKLLARLKDTVTIIDRPHGQHVVVSAEDGHRFMRHGGFDYLGGLNSSSRQIYMTFPAESTFTEKDVSNYFRTYGPVHDVRMPFQQKRMFGFVTFIYPETVITILAKGNPHYVGGARVLVKPYREKGRKFNDKFEQPKYRFPSNIDTLAYEQMQFDARIFVNSGLARRQMEEQEQKAIEHERRRLAELHLATAEAQEKQLIENQASSISVSTATEVSERMAYYEEKSRVEDVSLFSSNNHFGYLFDVLENSKDGSSQPTNKSNDNQERCCHILPESPFGNISRSNGNVTLHSLDLEETKNSIMEEVVTIPRISGQASITNKQLACSICLDALVDPKHLECRHAYCMNCMPKVGKMSHFDEGLICGQQSVKLSSNKVMQELLGKQVAPAARLW